MFVGESYCRAHAPLPPARRWTSGKNGDHAAHQQSFGIEDNRRKVQSMTQRQASVSYATGNECPRG